MTITFTGDKFESSERVFTNCFSHDRAFADFAGNYGFPGKSIVEVFGPKSHGKTTYCLSLMAMMAKTWQKNTTIMDWEGQSRDTIEGVFTHQGFFGNVEYILQRQPKTKKDKGETSEETAERFLATIHDEDRNIALFDSIGGFIPTAYSEGEIGDANMGVFAREIGRLTSKIKQVIISAETPGAVFMTNHEHPKIGSFVGGSETAGGVRKKYLSHVRIQVGKYFGGKKSPVSGYVSLDDGWLLKGKVENNRYGYSGREFSVWMVGGEGIHVGMTALFDCVLLGIAKLSAKKVSESNTVSLDGNSYGKLGYIMEHRNDDPDFFSPFINALRENEMEEVEDDSQG